MDRSMQQGNAQELLNGQFLNLRAALDQDKARSLGSELEAPVKDGRGLGLHAGRSGGFSLVEMMIVVVIMTTLIGIALPSYNNHVSRTARNEARAVLAETQLWLESRMTANNTYLDNGAAPTLPFTQAPKKGTAKYKISFLGTPTATSYVLRAVPETGVDRGKCGTFTIDQTGAKNLTGTHSLTVVECWGGK